MSFALMLFFIQHLLFQIILLLAFGGIEELKNIDVLFLGCVIVLCII